MDAIQNTITQLQQAFIQRMDAYQTDLQAAVPTASITSLSADFSVFRTFIMSALQNLQDQVGLLSNHIDNLEMRNRRKILLLHGVPESKKEDVASEAVKIIVKKLNMPDFSSSDISRCHRMGRMSASDHPRPILFKLKDSELRNSIWQAKSGLKGSGITLSEFLTKSRHDTFMAARQKFGVAKCWTREGYIFVLGASGERHRIVSLAELETISSPESSNPTAAKDRITSSKTRRAAALLKQKGK